MKLILILPQKTIKQTLHALVAAALATLGSSRIAAQTVSADSSLVVELSPFQVTSDKDVGYQGGNTTSGSRLNTSLKDTAAAITAFTPEFLSDLGATSLADIIGYAPDMEKEMQQYSETPDTFFFGGSDRRETTIRIRGLSANTSMDFFPTGIMIDTFNTERIEQSSGPNAILFGFGSPGGLVNTSTKRANVNRNRTSFRLQVGSFSYKRFEVDHNQVLIPHKLALRLNGVTQRAESWRKYNFNDSDRIAASLQWRPWEKTALTVNYEVGRLRNSIDRSYNAFDSLAFYEASGAATTSDALYNATSDHARGINRNTSVRTIYITDSNGKNPVSIYNTNATGRRFLESTYDNLNIPVAQRAGATLLPASQLSYDINIFGPGGWRKTNFNRVFATLEHRLTRNMAMEIAYNHEYGYQYAQAVYSGTNIFYRDPNTVIPNSDGSATPVANPNVGRYYMEAHWGADKGAVGDDAIRSSLSWDLDLGRWGGRHSLAGLIEYNKYNAYRYGGIEIMVDETNAAINTAASPGNNNNRIFRRQYVTLGDYETYIPGSPDDPVTVTSNGKTYHNAMVFANTNGNDIDRITKTLMLASQSRFFNNRLVLTGGIRKDRIDFDTHVVRILGATDPEVIAGKAILNSPIYTGDIAKTQPFNPRTVTYGAVLHATKVISVFYNHANNNGAPAPNARVLPNLNLPPPVSGVTDDAGFMLDLLDGRVFLRATGYKTAQVNNSGSLLSSSVTAPNRLILDTLLANQRITQAEYDQREFTVGANVVGLSDSVTRGYSVSLSFNSTKSLTGLLSFSRSAIERDNLITEFEGWYDREKAFWLRTPGAGALTNPTTGVTISQYTTDMVSNIAIARDALRVNYGERPFSTNGSGRYSFLNGKFKGAFIGGGIRWAGKAMIGREVVSVDATTGSTTFGGRYYGPESFNVDAFVGYRTKFLIQQHKTEFSVQLNVYNLTDEPAVQLLRYNKMKTGYSKVLVGDPRLLRFTANLAF